MYKILHLLIAGILMCCNSQSPELLWDKAKHMQANNDMQAYIVNLESLIKKFPKHDLAARAQYHKAEYYLNDVKDFDYAITEFEKVINQHTNHDFAKNSLFMIAYIYNNYLNSFSDAIDNYNLFKSKYPDDELIQSVEYELNGLLNIKGTIDSLNLIVSQKKNI